MVDISDPTNLVEAAVFHLADYVYALDVEAAEGRVYVSMQWNDYPGQNTGLRILELGPEYAPTLEVAIDINPGSGTTTVNPRSQGVIPIAILSSDAFDATDVDRTTLSFGPHTAAPAHSLGGHPEDVNGDGITDLVSHFWMRETGIARGDTDVCLSGRMLGGTAFQGCDAIRSRP